MAGDVTVKRPPMRWHYGITTVPSRWELFLRTRESLARAGFENPWLFVDGVESPGAYRGLGSGVSVHYPAIKTAANWVFALAELFVREPACDRYAVFQDDLVTCRNLRLYLERKPIHNEYLNLFSFPANEKLAPPNYRGWYPSDQRGKGAVALVFDREGVTSVLSNRQYIVQRPMNAKRATKGIDGGVACSMLAVGAKELVHAPCLVQHVGLQSSMGNKPHPQSATFVGEDFDALTLLEPALCSLLQTQQTSPASTPALASSP